MQTHLFNPLHVIEVGPAISLSSTAHFGQQAWMNDAFFQRVSLMSLGLVIWLGHKPTETLEMCSLLYHEGECPKAQAKQSIVWYGDDKQCLLYPNVNQMIT
jgi:hypothetical protein